MMLSTRVLSVLMLTTSDTRTSEEAGRRRHAACKVVGVTLPADIQELNSELLRQGLFPVNEDKYDHRMGQAMAPLIHQSRKSKAGDKLNGTPRNTAGIIASSSQATGPESLQDDQLVLPSIRGQPNLARYLPGE